MDGASRSDSQLPATPLAIFEGSVRLYGLDAVLLGILPDPADAAIMADIRALPGVPDAFRLGEFLSHFTLTVPADRAWDEDEKARALNRLTHRVLGLIVLAHGRTHGCLFDEDGHIVIERRASQD